MVSALATNPVPATDGAAFKETEIGLLPVEWEVCRIGEFATVKTGPFGTLLKASEYSDGDGVPLISVGEIRHGYLSITDDTPRVCEVVTKRLPQYVLKAGDIVFGRKGGVERSALLGPQHDGWFLGSDGLSIRLSSNFHPAFVAYQFQTSSVQQWLLANAIGTTMPSLNQGILANVAIAIPPTRKEQEAIAEALSDADALIESLEALIAKKRAIKQGAMQDLLTGCKRIPGFTGEWKPKKLGELGTFLKGSGVRKDEAQSGELPCVRYGEIYTAHHDVVRDFQSFISREVASTATEVRAGDVLFAGSGETKDEIGKSVAIVDCEKAYAGGDIVILRSANCDARFLGYALNHHRVQKQKSAKGQGDAVVHISATALATVTIDLPPFDEQIAIGQLIDQMDTEIALLGSKLAKVRQIKQGMMQELLTGRVRLV